MSSIDWALDAASRITGTFAVALIDYESGLTLGARGGSPGFDLDVAAAGNTELVRTELDVLARLGIQDPIDDILITLSAQYHVIRPVASRDGETLFFHLALNRAQANLAMARRDLRMIVDHFYDGAPRSAVVTDAGEPGSVPHAATRTA
ncbi:MULTISPECIES: hypothetical protein [Pseudonocardia]|uniref:Roadblock/LC7 domain protein n=2 Tax=Pseudonocardia TaxID=1847 RepID=A0A1Y2MIB3_PSEAH|nr:MULTISPECIES: hypothetical protein [Pseudonocardia]OSY35004.1 hypothetical protein BG845_06387 [Pseudonocardia autotrophica]TDN73209.1 hypothetical protein C8E95_2294 [Pseudonocardia autotrophica]BBG03940.1 hypothetical protein Pdca_51490 [Pseudonocardia autotrophica]GEC28324.1 hypothetical protein PSA01_53530 [Pseudonocardia saturnea]